MKYALYFAGIVTGIVIAHGPALLSLSHAADGIAATEQQQINALAERVEELERKEDKLSSVIQVVEQSSHGVGSRHLVFSTGKVMLQGRLEATEVTASSVKADYLKGNTLIVDSVVSNTYTPGAGNIW